MPTAWGWQGARGSHVGFGCGGSVALVDKQIPSSESRHSWDPKPSPRASGRLPTAMGRPAHGQQDEQGEQIHQCHRPTSTEELRAGGHHCSSCQTATAPTLPLVLELMTQKGWFHGAFWAGGEAGAGTGHPPHSPSEHSACGRRDAALQRQQHLAVSTAAPN